MEKARSPLAAWPGALLALAACAPTYGDAYLRANAAGERAYHAGRYIEAAAAYDDAASRALRVKDRDEARFLQSRSLERADRFAEAEAALRRLIADSPSGPRTPRALFDIADLEIHHGDAAKGYRLLEEATDKYPNHGLARPALRRLIDHARDEGGDAAVLTFLERKRPLFRGTEESQMVDYEIALCLERMGQKGEAHDALLATARAHPYPKGPLTDDALVHAARLDLELGRAEEATRHLRAVLASREEPSLASSEERPRYPEAQFLLAEIYRDALKDHAAARREFGKVCSEHERSRKCDDALWAEARLAREDGDQGATCRIAKKLVEELPDSRYAPCARLLCPTAPGTKRACADYITRDLRGGAEAE